MGTSAPRLGPSNSVLENSLAAWEAALHLGITPELLFYYTSRGFQRRPGETRRLLTFYGSNSTRFLVSELDAFDNYLREPWAEVGEARRDPPQKVLAYQRPRDHMRAPWLLGRSSAEGICLALPVS